MKQIALPLSPAAGSVSAPRIIVGGANASAVEALQAPQSWPFRTAVLTGPARSGKSLLARWFVQSGLGAAIDDADAMDEDALFHRWNRAQEERQALLIVSNASDDGWNIALPDLASRLGAAMRLEIGPPDDAMLADLIALHAEMRGLALDETATAYLVGRCVRSHLGVEQLVGAIDRISLERKQAPGLAIWREALEEIAGPDQPRLL
jgi:hypothetical protein